MGFCLPAAIGAAFGLRLEGRADTPVISISGDGGFVMNAQEMSVAAAHKLPIKIIVINNRFLGMVRQWQELTFGNRESHSYMDSLPDFIKLAESFGIKGMQCANPQELDDKLQAAINHSGPVLFNCIVEKSENVFPMIPAGAAHNEILLGKQAKEYVQKDHNAV